MWETPRGESGILGEHPPKSFVTTDADGYFDVGSLDMSSEYFVRVRKDGFAIQCREIVRAGDFLIFQLATGSRIFGHVEGIDDKLLATNKLLVTAWSASSTGPSRGRRNYLDGCWVDPRGLFEFQGVPPGTRGLVPQIETPQHRESTAASRGREGPRDRLHDRRGVHLPGKIGRWPERRGY